MKTKLYKDIKIGDEVYWNDIDDGPIPNKELLPEDMYAGKIVWIGTFEELMISPHKNMFDPEEWGYDDGNEQIPTMMEEDWDLVIIEDEDWDLILCNYDNDPSGVICLEEDSSPEQENKMKTYKLELTEQELRIIYKALSNCDEGFDVTDDFYDDNVKPGHYKLSDDIMEIINPKIQELNNSFDSIQCKIEELAEDNLLDDLTILTPESIYPDAIDFKAFV